MPEAAVKSRRYHGDPYWEREKPVIADTNKIRLMHYKEAGRLQVQYRWTDAGGEVHYGKVVTVLDEDLACFPEALGVLKAFLVSVEALGTK